MQMTRNHNAVNQINFKTINETYYLLNKISITNND